MQFAALEGIPPELLDEDALNAELARRSLAEFAQQAWQVVEPDTRLEWGWYHGAICEHLEAVTLGQIRRLIINIGPGFMKSTLVSVMWPAWMWTRRPAWRGLFGSYAHDLATRDSDKTRKIVTSDWYQRLFRPAWTLDPALNRLDHFRNTELGERKALSVGGAATGFRGNAVVVDDPLNVLDAYSKAAREECVTWWDKAMSSRVNDPRKDPFVVIMQRLHVKDLTGHLLEQGGWEHLCLPTQYEPKRRCSTPIGFADPRTDVGELLDPIRFGPTQVKDAKRILGTDGFAGQHQQLPAPAEGAMLKRDWFNRRWRTREQATIDGLECRLLPEKFTSLIIVLDCSFKETKDTDRVAMELWGYAPPDRYLLDIRWDRMDFVTTLRTFADFCNAHKDARAKIVEEKANGAAIINALKAKVPGLIPVDPVGSKEARVAAVSPDIEAGNVWLPAFAPWVGAFIEECVTFPKGDHDDALDAMTYALLRLSPGLGSQRLAALVRW
jgi:predicted phage terminase large subunit-like protein